MWLSKMASSTRQLIDDPHTKGCQIYCVSFIKIVFPGSMDTPFPTDNHSGGRKCEVCTKLVETISSALQKTAHPKVYIGPITSADLRYF